MKRILAALLLALAMAFVQTAQAEDKIADVTDMQALEKAVQTDKKAYVAAILKLNAAEARKFWPLYDAYQRTLDATDQRRVVVVERLIALDKPLSDLYAKSLATELLAADDAEVKARRILQTRVMKALSPRRCARYLQLESKIRAIRAYTIASTIPLIK
jgi:outer membrane PBP1 activator LpoA protein